MRKLKLLCGLVFLFLAGCSASATGDQALDGEGLYQKSCVACHAADFNGGAFGPSVVNMGSKYSEEEIVDMIVNGVGKMPGKLLPEDEAKLVTKWLMEK